MITLVMLFWCPNYVDSFKNLIWGVTHLTQNLKFKTNYGFMMCLSVSLHYIKSLHEAITSSQCFLKNYALWNTFFKVCYIWNQVNALRHFFPKFLIWSILTHLKKMCRVLWKLLIPANMIWYSYKIIVST